MQKRIPLFLYVCEYGTEWEEKVICFPFSSYFVSFFFIFPFYFFLFCFLFSFYFVFLFLPISRPFFFPLNPALTAGSLADFLFFFVIFLFFHLFPPTQSHTQRRDPYLRRGRMPFGGHKFSKVSKKSKQK
jgi:hypothetical protein